MTRHTVFSPLRHNGTLYMSDDTVELTPEEARSLILSGVVGEALEESEEPHTDDPPADGTAVIDEAAGAPAGKPAPRKRGKRA